jgi:hypothetical protein
LDEFDLRWFDMPATEVELHHGNETLDRIVNFGHWEQGFGMCHEACYGQYIASVGMGPRSYDAYFVILSSILRGSKMKVGSTTLLRSAPGRSWEMICDSTVYNS